MKPKIPSHISTCCNATHTGSVHSLGEEESGLHYTNDTLLYTENSGILEDVFADIKIGLTHYGLIMAPEKIQLNSALFSNFIPRKVDKVFNNHYSKGGSQEGQLQTSKWFPNTARGHELR